MNGKKCGRNPGARLRPELGAGERVQRAAQMRHRQAAIHRQPLDLMEDRRVGGVEFVGAEGAADRDDVDRQLALEQRADLHRRGVGAQQLPGAFGRDVEGVLFAARRMVGREVQRVEVELLGLDLGPLGQFPAHRDEGVGDVLGQDRDRMPGAGRLPRRRQRHVDAFGEQHRGVALGPQRRQPFVVGALGFGACRVDPPARVGALGLGQSRQCLARQRQRRAVTEVLGLGPRQRVEVGRERERLPRCADRLGQRLGRQIDGLIPHAANFSLADEALFGRTASTLTGPTLPGWIRPIISYSVIAARRAFPYAAPGREARLSVPATDWSGRLPPAWRAPGGGPYRAGRPGRPRVSPARRSRAQQPSTPVVSQQQEAEPRGVGQHAAAAPTSSAAGRRNREATSTPRISATAWPASVNSPPTTTADSPAETHQPTQAGRQPRGIAAVSAPSTATAP